MKKYLLKWVPITVFMTVLFVFLDWIGLGWLVRVIFWIGVGWFLVHLLIILLFFVSKKSLSSNKRKDT